MKELVSLYWGTVFLMYLSQIYYPVKFTQDNGGIGRKGFMWRKADIFMIIVIVWMTCFSFLRTSYNDSLLSSKEQKNNRMMQPCKRGCFFRPYLRLILKTQIENRDFVSNISIRVSTYIKVILIITPNLLTRETQPYGSVC